MPPSNKHHIWGVKNLISAAALVRVNTIFVLIYKWLWLSKFHVQSCNNIQIPWDKKIQINWGEEFVTFKSSRGKCSKQCERYYKVREKSVSVFPQLLWPLPLPLQTRQLYWGVGTMEWSSFIVLFDLTRFCCINQNNQNWSFNIFILSLIIAFLS